MLGYSPDKILSIPEFCECLPVDKIILDPITTAGITAASKPLNDPPPHNNCFKKKATKQTRVYLVAFLIR